MASVAARLALLSACAAVVGCSTNHDLLAQKPDQPGSEGGPGDGAGNETFPVTPRNDASPVDAGDPEPPGPWLLTLVNGLVDLDAARFCFVPLTDGAEQVPEGPPVPEPPGLAFGAHLVLSELGPIDLATMDVHPYLIIGADGLNAQLSCRQVLQSPTADAASGGGPSLPVAVSLPLIPARTLAESRSYLAAVTGCANGWPAAAGSEAGSGDASAGDAGEDASDGSSICGKGLGGSVGPGLSLVRLSRRVNVLKLGFQTMNASSAATPASLLITQAITNNTIFSSDALDTGQISPHAQPGYVAKSDFGISFGSVTLHVVPPAGSAAFSEFQSFLDSVLALNHFMETDLTEGSNYTFVLLGAQPGQEAVAPWHPFRIALVETAPKAANGDP